MNRNQPDTSLPKPPAVIKYIANLTQTSTGNPVAHVLYNNADLSVSWTRGSEGQYQAEITDYAGYTEFNLRLCGTATCQQSAAGSQISVSPGNYEIDVTCWNGSAFQDGGLTAAAFELTIYRDQAKFY